LVDVGTLATPHLPPTGKNKIINRINDLYNFAACGCGARRAQQFARHGGKVIGDKMV
jgi:hypothetical protein